MDAGGLPSRRPIPIRLASSIWRIVPTSKQALAGAPAISDVLASRVTGNPIVVIATPVMDGEKSRVSCLARWI